MNERTYEEAQALALLVGGRAVGDRVFLPKPSIGRDSCTGCCLAARAKKDDIKTCLELNKFNLCMNVIWYEVDP